MGVTLGYDEGYLLGLETVGKYVSPYHVGDRVGLKLGEAPVGSYVNPIAVGLLVKGEFDGIAEVGL